MSRPRSFQHCDITEPLHPPPSSGLNDDDVTTDTDTRRDDVPVLACENGVCTVQPLPAKKSQYLKGIRWPRRLCTLRCREVVILSIGVVLTFVALGLIVAGALRSDEHGSTSAFLHVSSMVRLFISTDLYHQFDLFVARKMYNFSSCGGGGRGVLFVCLLWFLYCVIFCCLLIVAVVAVFWGCGG